MGTPFDFHRLTAIGARIDNADEQLRFGKGYDHNWVLNESVGPLRINATIYEPIIGRVLEVWSDQPGLEFYTGNELDGTIVDKGGWPTPRTVLSAWNVSTFQILPTILAFRPQS